MIPLFETFHEKRDVSVVRFVILQTRIVAVLLGQISGSLYEPRHDKTNKVMCAQRRLRSTWASTQSDRSLRCPHEKSLGPYRPIKRTAKNSDQTGQMPRLI